jgi:hypothetical protein
MEQDTTKAEAKTAEVMPTPQAGATKTSIPMSESGMLIARTLDEEFRLAKMHIASGMVPVRFNTEAALITGMQYARELRLPPLTSLRQIAVVHGTPCTFGDLPLAMVHRDGKMEWMDEFLVDTKGVRICYENKNLSAEPAVAVCIVKRKGDKEPVERTWSFEDTKRAGIKSPSWDKYPKIMLKYRARSQALKDKFPDSLNGVAIAEYDFHEIPTEDGPAITSAADDLNKKFLEGAP